jgi:predicted lipoprotein with Yx(FWY)xxD motif
MVQNARSIVKEEGWLGTVSPTAGTGATGKLATITRKDDGTLQVTYNGLPLHFYQGDKAPGDTNGSYPNWNLVTP